MPSVPGICLSAVGLGTRVGEGRACRTSQDVCQQSPHLQLEDAMPQVGLCTSFGRNQQFKPLNEELW